MKRPQVPDSVERTDILKYFTCFHYPGDAQTEGALVVLENRNFSTVLKPEFTFSVSSRAWVA